MVEIEGLGIVKKTETFFDYVRRVHNLDAQAAHMMFFDHGDEPSEYAIQLILTDGNRALLALSGELIPAEFPEARNPHSQVSPQ